MVYGNGTKTLMAPWHFAIYARISLQNWRPPLTLCINYMIHTHPWRNFFPVLQFHSIILRHWTSLTHTGTIMIFMLLLQRWKSKCTNLSREMLCCCLQPGLSYAKKQQRFSIRCI